MRHNQKDENRVNNSCKIIYKEHQSKVVAANSAFASEEPMRYFLLCVRDGEKQATPIGRGRGYQFGLPNQEYYFKQKSDAFSVYLSSFLSITELLIK
jgi:DNA polymerase-3 subunit alpha